MKKNFYAISLVLFFSNIYADAGDSIQPVCREELNISEFWHEGMTWEEFLKIRNELHRKELIKYVDKIESQKMALESGLEITKTYIASREKVPFVDIISNLENYVVKMTHLSMNDGIMIVKDGINTMTGEQITPEEVQEMIFRSFEEKPRKWESWALHQVQPGFMVQEYIPLRNEVCIQTIWGKAMMGQLKIARLSDEKKLHYSMFDRDGNRVSGRLEIPEWWSQVIAAAELMAQGTDALRVDFFIKDGEILFNELEIYSAIPLSVMETVIEDRLNEGYRKFIESSKEDIEDVV